MFLRAQLAHHAASAGAGLAEPTSIETRFDASWFPITEPTSIETRFDASWFLPGSERQLAALGPGWRRCTAALPPHSAETTLSARRLRARCRADNVTSDAIPRGSRSCRADNVAKATLSPGDLGDAAQITSPKGRYPPGI